MALSVQWLALQQSSLGAHADQHPFHSALGFLWASLIVPEIFLGLGWEGFLGGASGREPGCQFRRHKRHGFDHWVGKSPWRRAWQPTPVFLPGESPWIEEPGGLQSIGSKRVGHNWSDLAQLAWRVSNKEGLFVSFQHSHHLPVSLFPQPISLTTLDAFDLDETCAALTCTSPLTFVYFRLQGQNRLYSVSYFLPEIQISCHKKECWGWICPDEPYNGFAPEIVVSEWQFSVPSFVSRVPIEGLSETETVFS